MFIAVSFSDSCLFVRLSVRLTIQRWIEYHKVQQKLTKPESLHSFLTHSITVKSKVPGQVINYSAASPRNK